MEGVIAFVSHLSFSVNTVYVANNESRYQLNRAKNVCSSGSFTNQLISSAITEKIPALPTAYQVITSFKPLPDNTDIDSGNLTTAIHALKDLLLNSIVLSQQSYWNLVTQVEFYYKDLAIDDVAMINKHERYEKQPEVNFEKCQEGRGTWYELRFTYQQLEVIATGGLFSKKTNESKVEAFLGVAAPSHMAHDTHFVLLAPTEPAAPTSCPRTLRNYQPLQMVLQSSYFEEMGFSTPRPLKLYETEPASYVAISSKLINLISRQKYTPSKQRKLKKMLLIAKYYKNLGFEKPLKSKKTLEALKDITNRESTIKRKPSIRKILVIQLLLQKYSNNIENRIVMQIYNSIIAPRIKVINQKRVKEVVARI